MKHYGTDVNGRPIFLTPDACLWLGWIEDLLHDRGGLKLTVFQGGFRPVSDYSSGTHGKDAVDAWVWGWTGDELMRFLKRHGAFGWHRTKADGFDEHCHFGPIPGPHNGVQLAPEMAGQLASYRNLRNGLVNNAADRNPYRPSPQYIFNREDVMELSDKQINQIATKTAAKLDLSAIGDLINKRTGDVVKLGANFSQYVDSTKTTDNPKGNTTVTAATALGWLLNDNAPTNK